MAPLHIRPRSQLVAVDPAGRPREVVIDHRPVPVSEIEAVREEVAAYPPSAGPRTLFLVRAGGSRLRLTREHRTRRWTVEILRADEVALAPAA